MNAKHERQIEVDATPTEVSVHLKKWAQATGFVCTTETPPQWSFHRGSQLQALYTFDFRKLPTDVEVSISGERPVSVHCTWHISAPLSISTPGDPVRISEQFDLLVAYLRGAL